jgi:cytochrome P450
VYPPVLGVMRRSIKLCEIAGHQVAAYTLVQVSILVNHYWEQYRHDPFVFDSLRFAEGRQAHKQQPYLWAPFGGGSQVHRAAFS